MGRTKGEDGVNGHISIGKCRAALAIGLLASALASCEASESGSNGNGADNEAAAPVSSNAVMEIVPPSAQGPGNETAEAPAPETPEAPASKAWSASGYRLVGTEPFWGGTVSPTRIVYMTPDNQAGEKISVDAAYGAAREVYSGTLGGGAFVLTLTKGPCSDGMSDKVHKFSAALQVKGETRQGCADPQ